MLVRIHALKVTVIYYTSSEIQKTDSGRRNDIKIFSTMKNEWESVHNDLPYRIITKKICQNLS